MIPVSTPVKRDVTDYVDYTGRTDAVESVGIRARVTGYIVGIPFQEGAEVKKYVQYNSSPCSPCLRVENAFSSAFIRVHTRFQWFLSFS